MRSREYTKRVEFYTTTAVSDGYGGSTVSDSLYMTSWAKVRTPNKNDVVRGFGIDDPANMIIISLRHRIDKDYTIIQYAKYNGIKYVVNGIFNIDLLDVDIEITATKE